MAGNSTRVKLISARQALYREIRSYFDQQAVLEVEVPLLARAGTTDPQIASFKVEGTSGRGYLQSSPEYFLKRLLCDIRHSCFSIGKAFRDEEQGAKHNPEFSMLEWYRIDFDLEALIEECIELICIGLGRRELVRIETYKSIFQHHLGIDPHQVQLADLQPLVGRHTSYGQACESVPEALQLLLSQLIEPEFSGLTVIRDFPADQAALAQIAPDASGQLVARRFEIYLGSTELANGYQELTDAEEQRRRFQEDINARRLAGREIPEMDQALLLAMSEPGLPDCCGVSIGLDRLLMTRMGLARIEDVLLFSWDKV